MAAVCLLAGTPLVFATSAVSQSPSPDGVIAFVDTGINPYHETFRDDSPRAREHPSTYIPGYPGDAIALHLTFGPDYWESVRADCERVWKNIDKGKLYWVPGTRIVGAISFGSGAELDCGASKPAAAGVILDAHGHGTMVASRAASREYGACAECLIVAVEGLGIDSIEWAAENAHWIDAQSNSWGPGAATAWVPTNAAGRSTSNPQFVRAVEGTSRLHLSLWGAGNGAGFRLGVLGHPTTVTPHFTPSVVVVGGHDSGYVNTWPGFPAHVVADSCHAWGAERDHASKSGDRRSSGTSSATPFAGGIALEILRAARQILGSTDTGVHSGVVARGKAGLVREGPLADGVFTLDEWKRVLYVTATRRPEGQPEDGPSCGVTMGPYSTTPVRWVDVPPQYPEYLQIGYGAADRPALELARRVLRGQVPAPDRAKTDEFFAHDRRIRTTAYEVFSKP